MQPDQPIILQPKKRRLPLILIAIGVVLVSCVVVVLILRSVTPSKSTTTSTSGQVVNVHDTLASYQNAIPVLASSYQQITGPLTTMVYYQQPGSAYRIGLTSPAVSFTATSSTQIDDTKAIQDQTTTFLTKKGMTLQKTPDYSTTTTAYTTLAGASAVCQLSTTTPANGTARTVNLGCNSQSEINKEYDFINTLLGLYTKADEKPTFTQASRNLVTSGNKSLSILQLTGGATPSSLLFAAIDNQWEYIAQLSTGASTTSNGKFVPSPELTTALNNPKYGDFLTKNIQ
jgi:hypothetical protein